MNTIQVSYNSLNVHYLYRNKNKYELQNIHGNQVGTYIYVGVYTDGIKNKAVSDTEDVKMHSK